MLLGVGVCDVDRGRGVACCEGLTLRTGALALLPKAAVVRSSYGNWLGSLTRVGNSGVLQQQSSKGTQQ